MGINCSELDGFVIKNSSIGCRLDATKNNHCVYLSSNCSNVRITSSIIHNVSGDAIHKAYPVSLTDRKADISKNHFYTDLSINDADSALDIGIISQNVMCDNIFATEVKIILQLCGADNCIVSNSYFGQHEESTKSTTFIYAQNSCNCWMQNSYVKYNGKHRVTYEDQESEYLSHMFADDKHRRLYIGPDFDIPNHWFKFTGCEIESIYGSESKYFAEVFNEVGYSSPDKSQFGEYSDNCSYSFNRSTEIYRILAINNMFGGITYRNCYMKNMSASKNQPPFGHLCHLEDAGEKFDEHICPYNDSVACVLLKNNKKYPWMHFENNIYDSFSLYYYKNSWDYYFKSFKEKLAQNRLTNEQAATLLGAYSSNCYNFIDNNFQKISNLSSS